MNSKLLPVIFIAICLIWVSGCGLRLKGSVATLASNKRIFVTGIPTYNPFTIQLKDTLALSGGSITSKLDAFDLHLHVLDQRRTRRELSLSQRGKANEYELTFEITFEVIDTSSHQLMPQQTISITRDYFNQQLRVLGKANEEEMIWKEIYKTTVNNFLQRLDIAMKQPIASSDEIKPETE